MVVTFPDSIGKTSLRSISRLIIIGLFFLQFTCVVADQPVKEGKVLIMVYAAGGSLESEYGLITDDIRQMVTGAGNTTPDILEVLVAYGGSDKPGWQGMNIANISGLTADLKDGEPGNHTHCLASFPDADMGSYDTFGQFLTWTRDHYRYNRVFLILIGHGEAYTGMLYDQNHENDPLTLTEMVRALQIGGFNVELIGFDTCLMGSLEVASRMSGYARYMVASQESEPAEGWRYDTFISFLADHPEANATEYGAALCNGYMETKAAGKTLSLLDLNEAGVVTASLDRYSKNLLPVLNTYEGYSSLRQAFNASQQFGLTSRGTLDPATMDLADVAIKTSETDPLLVESANDLVNAIRRMVLLSVHDDVVPGAQGIAILSPVQINTGFYQYYLDEASITPSWDRFMSSYLEISGDPENVLKNYST